MTKEAFDKIAEGLNEALGVVRDRRAEDIVTLGHQCGVLYEALKPFVFGSKEVFALLYDGMDDNKTGTITAKLGDFRRARAAIESFEATLPPAPKSDGHGRTAS